MYQLLIVEDEKWEREGLRDFLDWDNLGIEVAGCACNGVEGIKMAELFRPQIILTDIMMPKMDGIRMSRNIRAFLPNAVIIILSGYDDFQYAKQSFDFHAFAYILKPIQKKLIEDVLLKAVKILDHEKIQKKEQGILESQWLDYVSMNRDHLLLDFLECKTDLRYIQEIAPIIKLKVSGKKVVAILSLCFYGRLSDNNMQKVMNSFSNMLGERGIAVSYRKLPEVVICMDAPDTRQELEKELLKIKDSIKKKFGMETIIGIGEVVEDLVGAPQSYAQAREASSSSFLAECGELLFYSQMKEDDQKNKDVTGQLILKANDITSKVVYCIQKGDIDESIRLTEDFLMILRENRSIGKILLNSFFMGVMNGLGIVLPGSTNPDICEKVLNKEKSVVDFSTLGSLSQTRQYLAGFLKSIAEHENDKKSCHEDNVAKRVIEIIEDRYADKLDLKLISEEIHLSPYYIGSIFKKYTGKVFNQYLNDYRINKAKELLQSKKIKVHHLARAVGIRSSSYFCALFKSKFGVSPGEYIELLKGK